MVHLEEIEQDVKREVSRFHKPRSIVNTRNALALQRRVRRDTGLIMYPAVFRLYTNFKAYPEAYRAYVYVRESGTENNFYLVYLPNPLKDYLGRGKRVYLRKTIYADLLLEVDE